ncbi:hypothetical protein K432DRAFT_35345 [Lepidopterella palustris CBS 459.81]|uniref:Uncharacterized protein n=1 Tax=Lepidopterella palustris CBS 459.81 TaxID=1314670 RepID=A0A8E2EBA0_9PEZI|nr:hypothetical protein K432DRAFT_35345 [Lepidopterella palustris CBS 459.81]
MGHDGPSFLLSSLPSPTTPRRRYRAVNGAHTRRSANIRVFHPSLYIARDTTHAPQSLQRNIGATSTGAWDRTPLRGLNWFGFRTTRLSRTSGTAARCRQASSGEFKGPCWTESLENSGHQRPGSVRRRQDRESQLAGSAAGFHSRISVVVV